MFLKCMCENFVDIGLKNAFEEACTHFSRFNPFVFNVLWLLSCTAGTLPQQQNNDDMQNKQIGNFLEINQ